MKGGLVRSYANLSIPPEIPFDLWLLVSEARDGKLKYSLCHSLQELSWEELAARQWQRYFVERAFEDGKSELGMADYQVKKWRGWHHHMALVGAAMVFALAERQRASRTNPLTSVRDIVEMVVWQFCDQTDARPNRDGHPKASSPTKTIYEIQGTPGR